MFFCLLLCSQFVFGIDYKSFYDRHSGRSLGDLTANGFRCLGKAQPDSAFAYYSAVASKYNRSMSRGDKLECMKAFYNLGYIYFEHWHNTVMGYTSVLKAVDICEDIDEDKYRPSFYHTLGRMYTDCDDWEKAVEAYKKSYNMGVKQHDWSNVLRSAADFMTLAYLHQNWDMVRPEVVSLRELKLPRVPMSAYVPMLADALSCLHEGRFSEAVGLMRRAYGKIDSRVDPSQYRAYHLLLLSEAYRLDGSQALAMQALRQAGSIADGARMYGILSLALDMQAKLLEGQGQGSEAQALELRSLRLRDSIFSAKNYRILKDVKFGQDIDEYKNDILQVKEEKRVQARLLVSLSLVVLVIALLLVWVYRKNRALDFSNHVLFDKNAALRKNWEDSRRRRKEYEAHVRELESRLRQLDGQGTGSQADDDRACSETAPKSSKRSMNEADRRGIYMRVREVMEESDEIFSPKFSLGRLADLVGSKPEYVSSVINEQCQKNFSALLSEYRIAEACKRLIDKDKYGRLTIEAISEGVGYQSRAHFAKVFKKIVGLTPTEYLRIARDEGKKKHTGA